MKILKKLFQGNTLYYPGCLTKKAAKGFLNKYKFILKQEGIDFIELKDVENCCGSPLKNAGYEEEFKNMAEKNLAIFKDHGIDRIVSNCPACVLVLKNDYKELLGNRWDIKVEHITEIIDKSCKNISRKEEAATYHDSCHLGKGLGIYEKPRSIIKKSGVKIKEMELAKSDSYCCGAGGGCKNNDPELAKRIARERINQAKETGTDVLFTACPMCYFNLKDAADEKGVKVKELSEIFDDKERKS